MIEKKYRRCNYCKTYSTTDTYCSDYCKYSHMAREETDPEKVIEIFMYMFDNGIMKPKARRQLKSRYRKKYCKHCGNLIKHKSKNSVYCKDCYDKSNPLYKKDVN